KAATVGPPGRIVMPPSKEETAAVVTAQVTAAAATKANVLFSGPGTVTVTVNGKTVYSGVAGAAQPDQTGVDVMLKPGANHVVFAVKYADPKAALYARFLDPDRKLRYPE